MLRKNGSGLSHLIPVKLLEPSSCDGPLTHRDEELVFH